MAVGRGEIWWVDLGAPRRSAPAKRRPLLIVSADEYNRSAINTVIGAAITSNTRLAAAPGNVSLDEGEGGLRRASVVNVSQIVTIDKADLGRRIGSLDSATMRMVDAGLRSVLALRDWTGPRRRRSR